MNNLTLRFGSLLIFGLALPTWGQSSEPGPLAPLKPGMAWKVESLPESRRTLSRTEPPPSSPTVGKETVLEENEMLAQGFRKQFLPGEKLQRYLRDGLLVVADASGTDFSIQSLDPDLLRDQISSKSLLEFAWIAAQWKTGVATIDGVECDIYARRWPTDSKAENFAASANPDLWVHAAIGRQDRLPRRLEDPVSVKSFRFSIVNPPTEPPAGIILAIHRMNESAKEMAQRYAIPQ